MAYPCSTRRQSDFGAAGYKRADDSADRKNRGTTSIDPLRRRRAQPVRKSLCRCADRTAGSERCSRGCADKNLCRQGILSRCGKGEARNRASFSAASAKARHGFFGFVAGSQGETTQDFETVNLGTSTLDF